MTDSADELRDLQDGYRTLSAIALRVHDAEARVAELEADVARLTADRDWQHKHWQSTGVALKQERAALTILAAGLAGAEGGNPDAWEPPDVEPSAQESVERWAQRAREIAKGDGG